MKDIEEAGKYLAQRLRDLPDKTVEKKISEFKREISGQDLDIPKKWLDWKADQIRIICE